MLITQGICLVVVGSLGVVFGVVLGRYKGASSLEEGATICGLSLAITGLLVLVVWASVVLLGGG